MRALVIEGGGMRAAYANGVLAAWERAGLDDFDGVYGTSAGGALAAWWSAGQAEVALGTWAYAGDPRILSYRRYLTGRGPLLDHDALFRIVYERERPLDVQAIAQAPHPVIVTVTDANTGETHYQDIRGERTLDWLQATGRLPLATGPPVEIDGRTWLDGGITVTLPVQRAIDDGADEIVCVLNRRGGERRPEPRLIERLTARKYPALAGLVTRHHEIARRDLELAESPPRGLSVQIVRPSRPLAVGRLTRDERKLGEAMALGRRDGETALVQGRAPLSRAGSARPPS